MPFSVVARTEDDHPLWLVDEAILHEQPLTYLWAGDDVERDREGRGTLYITNQRILFFSDEDRTKNLAFDYADFSLHAISTSRVDWPHQHLLCKLAPPEDDAVEVEDAEEEQKAGDTTAAASTGDRWIRHRRKGRADVDDEEDEASAAVAPILDAASTAAAAVSRFEIEEHVVEELRFVPPQPASQLQLIYAAWNKGDDLNASDDDDDDDDDTAGSDAPAASSSGRRDHMLRRLDHMLIVPPVVPNAAPTPTSSATSSTKARSNITTCHACSIIKACSVCIRDRPECDFSGAQLKRKGKRICRECVARKEGTALPLLHGQVDPSKSTEAEADVEEDLPQIVVPTSSSTAPAAAAASVPSTTSASSRSTALFASIMQTSEAQLAELEQIEY